MHYVGFMHAKNPSHIFFPALIAIMVAATATLAAPVQYTLDAARSTVGFSFDFQGAQQTGTMPVSRANMLIDLDNVPASSVDVTLDPSGARAGVIFLTQTMKGPNVLDTARFPEIRFVSRRFTGDLNGASVTGDLTVRDITRPVTLKAGLFRQRGTQEGDRDALAVLLTGAISRAAFGADGFPGFVGDQIALRIIARIEK